MVEDFIDIFYAPASVYARRIASSFWVHFLIVAVIFGAFAYANRAVFEQIFVVEYERGAAEAMRENPQLTAQSMEQGRNFMMGIMGFLQYLGVPLAILLTSIVVWISARIVGAKISYGQSAMIMTLAYVPRIVQQLLVTIQSLLIDVGTITSMHTLSFSPARFMDPGTTDRLLMNIVGRFDLFTIWVTILIGIGIAVMGKVPRSKAAIAAVIVFVVGSLPMLN